MSKREIIEPKGVKRYLRRDERGRFTSDQVNVGESLARDRQRDAKHRSTPGQGDRGDRDA